MLRGGYRERKQTFRCILLNVSLLKYHYAFIAQPGQVNENF